MQPLLAVALAVLAAGLVDQLRGVALRDLLYFRLGGPWLHRALTMASILNVVAARVGQLVVSVGLAPELELVLDTEPVRIARSGQLSAKSTAELWAHPRSVLAAVPFVAVAPHLPIPKRQLGLIVLVFVVVRLAAVARSARAAALVVQRSRRSHWLLGRVALPLPAAIVVAVVALRVYTLIAEWVTVLRETVD